MFCVSWKCNQNNLECQKQNKIHQVIQFFSWPWWLKLFTTILYFSICSTYQNLMIRHFHHFFKMSFICKSNILLLFWIHEDSIQVVIESIISLFLLLLNTNNKSFVAFHLTNCFIYYLFLLLKVLLLFFKVFALCNNNLIPLPDFPDSGEIYNENSSDCSNRFELFDWFD